MDTPSAFFFGLENIPREHKYFHKLNLPQGGVTTDQQDIRTHALSFYEDLYSAEPCDRSAAEQLVIDQQQNNFYVIYHSYQRKINLSLRALYLLLNFLLPSRS